MIRDKQVQTGPIVIDLTGPDGNAFSLMGSAMRLGKQLELTKEQINLIITDMQSGDYENLIQVFDKHFGAFVILER